MTTHRTRRILPATAFAVLLVLVPPAWAVEQPADVTARFAGVPGGERVRAFELAGVLILRGRVTDPGVAAAIGFHARSLGYLRVANLIQTVDHDDEQLVRNAERALTTHRALDGCQFRVASTNGVVRVGGSVRHELQKDVALQVLRTIDGIQRVEFNLTRF